MNNNEKIFDIIFAIENYSNIATLRDQGEGIDYDWLSEERNKALVQIKELLQSAEK